MGGSGGENRSFSWIMFYFLCSSWQLLLGKTDVTWLGCCAEWYGQPAVTLSAVNFNFKGLTEAGKAVEMLSNLETLY